MFKKVVQKLELEGIIALIGIAVLLSSLLAYAIYQHQCVIHNVGEIKTIGIEAYQDPYLTIPLTNIDWGILDPSESKNYEGYVKSNSSVPIILKMNVTAWNPIEAEAYLNVTWNLEGHSLDPDQSSHVMFTLSVSPVIENITDFAFDMILYGVA